MASGIDKNRLRVIVSSTKNIVEVFTITIEGTREEMDSLREIIAMNDEANTFTTAIANEISEMLSKRERSK
jgi:hypothetical protein